MRISDWVQTCALPISEAQSAGVIDESERAMISSVMRLADRPVRGLMTPRTDVDWLDVDADEEEIRARLVETDRKRVEKGKGVAVRVDLGGRRHLKKKKDTT